MVTPVLNSYPVFLVWNVMRPLLVWGAIAVAAGTTLALYPHHANTVRQNDSAAIGRIRFIGETQITYARQHPQSGFACALSDLSADALYSGYRFELRCKHDQKG